MRAPACVLLVLIAAAPAIAQVQPPPGPPGPQPQGPRQPLPGMPGIPRDDGQAKAKTGTGRLSGRVVATDTGRPVRRALVRAISQDTPEPRSVSTDDDGRWELKELPAGRYTVSIAKGGYVNLAYGQRRPFEAGTVLELADGQALEKLDVSLPRAGVITGTVVDEVGEPVSNVRVSPMRQRFVGGQQRLMAMGPGDMTDDIGQYRLHGLAPGDYYVVAAPMGMMMFGSSADNVGYAQTFYPGTPMQQHAQRVSVSEGQEAQQINFSLAVSRVATISGTVSNASGKPIGSGMLMLVTASPGGMQTGLGVQLRPDGTFSHSNVPPGEYRLHVQHMPRMEQLGLMGPGGDGLQIAEIASLPLTVTGEDITGIALVTAPAATASGRIRFEGAAKPSTSAGNITLTALPVELQPGMPFGGRATVREDLTFELGGLSDRRRLMVNPPPGWFVKAVRHDGQDITDSGLDFRPGQRVEGLEVLLTQRTTELSGSVSDTSSKPTRDYVVVAYSPDSGRWGFNSRYIRPIRPNQDGRFSLKGLPPGEYLVVALEYLEPGEEGDPEQLERWRPHATSVTLKDGESKQVDLRVIS